MSNTLCKSKKKKNRKKRNAQSGKVTLKDATHVCRKCGRISDSKKKLCKAIKIRIED
tara:strand:+ start:8097 stop:8267 length:171 start_codon:yes stop_codon:yes gene_type:complete